MRGEVTISTQLTEEQYRALCLLADLRSCRRADVIQQALVEYIRRHAGAELRGLAAELRPSAEAGSRGDRRGAGPV